MTELSSSQVDYILKALAHPLRREILVWLQNPAVNFPGQKHGVEAGVCAGQIHERSGMSASTMSAHLAVLQKAGLIRAEKIGQWIFYARNEPVIAAFVCALPGVLCPPTPTEGKSS